MSYETTIDKARAYDQVRTAMQQGSAETPKSKPPEDHAYLAVIRAKAASAVYAYYNEQKKPAPLWQIFQRVQKSIQYDEQWHQDWRIPGKRTVDRRVNEAAEAKNYPDGITPIVAVRAGYYIPNPQRFEGVAKVMLEALLRGR
jgi:tryptophan 2,3-dioxygenase